MSPVNVHVNRSPVAGVISFFKYHPGKYLVAWHPKSSTENERTTVAVRMQDGAEVVFRQIAGALARRIKWYIKEGQAIEQGQGVVDLEDAKASAEIEAITDELLALL